MQRGEGLALEIEVIEVDKDRSIRNTQAFKRQQVSSYRQQTTKKQQINNQLQRVSNELLQQ